VGTLEVLAALGIVLLSVGLGFALGGYKVSLIPVPERPKLVRAHSFTKDVLLNPLQISFIEIGDGSPNSDTVHFIDGSTVHIDMAPSELEAN
jgi:hypothetical protein